MAFDVAKVREEFPILARQVHGKPLVYLDSAASCQKPWAVIEAMTRVMESSYSNVHRGLHSLANETTEAYEAARRSVAKLIHAGSVDEIVFTKGATEAINLVAASFGQRLVEGDEIILSVMEHHANIVPWHFLRQAKGVVLKFVPVSDDGELDMDAYRSLFSPRTRIVSLSHMSNVLGTVNPAAEIVAIAHAQGVPVLLDGCQSVVHEIIDVQTLDVDFYVFSGHKLYGPTGIGVLYGKADMLASMPPYQGGGEMIGSVALDTITYADPPHRFEAGTPAIIEAIGLGAAIDWLMAQDRHAMAAHEHALYERAYEAVRDIKGLRVLGTAPGKGAVLSFTIDGVHAHDLAQILDRYGVAVRAGTHCAEPLMTRFGVTSSARASFGLYNTVEEVDLFVDALIRAQTFFA